MWVKYMWTKEALIFLLAYKPEIKRISQAVYRKNAPSRQHLQLNTSKTLSLSKEILHDTYS